MSVGGNRKGFLYRSETLRTCLGVKVNVAVGGGSKANMKTDGESFSHEITNCQHYYNIIRGRQEERLFALQSLGGLGRGLSVNRRLGV